MQCLKLLLVDSDPIFRLGLRVALEQVPNVEVVSEAETYTAALQTLTQAQDPQSLNLVVLELGNAHSTSTYELGLQLCRQLKTQYSNLPILLLSHVQEPRLLLAAKATGIDGYCPKGIPLTELVAAMQSVASGGSYWFGDAVSASLTQYQPDAPPGRLYSNPLTQILNNQRLSGIGYINTSLANVTAQLQVPGLPLLEQAILAGKRRELLTARWLLNRFLPSPQQRQEVQPPPVNSTLFIPQREIPSSVSPRALQAELFAACINKLQFNLQNVTDVPLEIDILSPNKKRELLYLVLQHFANTLDEMRASQIDTYRLFELRNTILIDLWQAVNTEFFGKFSRVKVGDKYLEIVPLLRQEASVVETILQKIPLVSELLAYLLFQTNLQVDNTLYVAGSIEAKERVSMLLENLLIQVANGVVQPLLNRLADIEDIKQTFFNSQLISTREIERFRNNLSWQYRWRNYVTEAQAIFESRYELFVFAPRGIAKVSIYAPRTQELAQLSNIPLVVTLVLEFRDAIAPRLQSLLSLLGSGVVFILTQVIGRGIGLIGRGILQGIGSVSLSDRRNKKS
ncbi:DUF3685 domain-containing protein [Iningainema tapete]|uniref:DUF3685 domain-containing protein n=1 Tax=Iningainema tapete BLCC-T55 TaxID=2748662 RepID=A0A8J6XKY4_9CYAN|nr:DUF3685 domain-containing protein [Iningainema tapete]MBD2778805.1 DUF3685 domain-containing protein [Iningainema tapete BLCC-T55]